MTLSIGDSIMASDQSGHTAWQVPGRRYQWQVSWLPGRTVDRDTAITAMILTDIVGTGDVRPGHRLWPAVESWASELGLTGPDALTCASQPPPAASRDPEPPGRQPGSLRRGPDWEAAD